MRIYTLCLNVFFGVLLIWFLWWIFLDTGHTKKDEFQCELISDCLICPFFWRFSDKHDTHKFEGQNVEFSNVFSMFHQSKTSDHIQSTCCLFSIDEISLCDLWGRLFWWISLGTGCTGMTYLSPDDSWTHAIFTKMCFRTIIRYLLGLVLTCMVSKFIICLRIQGLGWIWIEHSIILQKNGMFKKGLMFKLMLNYFAMSYGS